MSRAARSLFAFGIYVTVAAISFIVAPAPVINLLRLPPLTDGWVRVIGLLALVIGAYDLVGSRAALVPYIRASVPIRFGFAAGVGIVVLAGQMPPPLLLFGAIDAAGALWTWLALQKDRRAVLTP